MALEFLNLTFSKNSTLEISFVQFRIKLASKYKKVSCGLRLLLLVTVTERKIKLFST